MAENTTIRDGFFDSLQKGAKWDVGVSINRTNPLPLDQYSVFKTEAELNTYIAGAFSYPGQIVALVGETETVIYYLAEKADHSGLEKIEVGSMPGVDNNSIEIKIDENGDEYLTLVGLEDAKVGASLVKGADGKISWSATTQSDLDADLTDIKSNINKLDVTVFGVETNDTDKPTLETLKEKYLDNGLIDRVDNLEDKFDSLGGIFNFQASITVGDNETISDKIDFVPKNGDVVLVNGKQEYVYVDGAWEPFGDPHGVETLAGTVATHTSNITDLQGRMTSAEGKIGAEATTKEVDGETVQVPASGLYAYADTVAANKASAAQAAAEATAAAALSPVSEQVETNKSDITGLKTNIDLKADKTALSAEVKTLTDAIATKADAIETTNALNEKATKDELTNGLAAKANKTDTETAIGGLNTRLTTAEGDIDKLEAAIGAPGEDGKYPVTSVNGRLATLETTDITHGTDIAGLKSDLGSIADTTNEDGTFKATAFGKAAEAKSLANSANTAAQQGIADAATAKGAADAAKAAADAAQEKADSAYNLANEKVANSVYTEKVAEIDGKLTAHDTAIGLRATTEYVNTELGKKVDQTAYDTKVGEIEGAIALKAAAADVEAELAKKADKTSTETAIKEINDKIGTLGNVMNFVGELEEVDGELVIKVAEGAEAKVPEDGDVGFFGAFEYVYINNEWVKFGDTSAEGGRISALETTVGDSNSGLVKAVAELQAEDVSIKATATALSTSVDSRFAAVNETLTSLGTNKVDVTAYNEKIAALEAADVKEAKDRDDAVKAEASARSTAITTLETYINDALAWGSF